MKSLRRTFLFILLPVVFIHCSPRILRNYSSLDIYIPEGINISADELKARLGNIRLTDGSLYTVRVTVYGYSPGAEVMSFSDEKNYSLSRGKAWIKGLVQVIRDNELVSADFIEASGSDRDEVLNRFAASVSEIIGKDNP